MNTCNSIVKNRFFNSLQQILRSDSIRPLPGICRHVGWQARRAFRRFPCELTISHSRLLAEKPTGAAALVNAMGMYDFHNMNLLKLVLARQPSTFLDIGANIGTYTLVASEVETASVVSLEPHPVTYAMLVRNVQRNGRKNIVCFNFAASNHNGQVDLTDRPDESINRVVGHTERAESLISVTCRTLDAMCQEEGFQPDVVKIDVEGYEVCVLAGFMEMLPRVSLVLIEGGQRSEVKQLLSGAGFAGPFYFHFDARTLSKRPQRRPEDPVYVNERSAEKLGLNAADVAEF